MFVNAGVHTPTLGSGVGRRCYSLSLISQFFEFRFRALPCRRPAQGETSTGRPLFGYIVSRMVVDKALSVTELPSTPKIKQQSSITNPHSETGHFHIKSMPKCGKFGAASTAGWGAGAAIFSPVGRVVLLQKGGPPLKPPPYFLEGQFTDAVGSLHLVAPTEFRHCLLRS